ncbi:gustatory receptor 8a-like, partial [Drosophila hydei]
MIGYHIDQVLRFHLRCYQLIGMHGLPLSSDVYPRQKSKLLNLWAGCLLTGFSGVVYMCLTSDDDFLYQGDNFSYFNDAMKFGFAEMAILSIYWETLSSQRVHLACFWQLYEALAATFKATPSVRTLRQQLLQHWRFLLIFYGTLLLELALLCVYVLMQEISRHLLLFWITFQPFVLVVHLRNTQFVLHLDLLRQELLQL